MTNPEESEEMEKPETEVLLVYQSLAQSIAMSAASYAMLAGVIGLGVLLDSAAMQWAGFVVAILIIVGLSRSLVKKTRYTIPEARKRLDEIEQKTQ